MCLYLFVCRLSILCLWGALLHRSFYYCLGMTAISRIYCVHWSIFLVTLLACLLLSWEIVWAFSVSFSKAFSCCHLVFLMQLNNQNNSVYTLVHNILQSSLQLEDLKETNDWKTTNNCEGELVIVYNTNAGSNTLYPKNMLCIIYWTKQ